MKKLLPAIALLFILAQCSKQTGPQGPQGNANVTTVYYTVEPGQWISQGTGNWEYTIPVDGITQSILDSGAVEVYLTYSSAGVQYEQAMPYYIPNGPSGLFTLLQGNIEMFFKNSTSNPGELQFRIVIIAGQ